MPPASRVWRSSARSRHEAAPGVSGIAGLLRFDGATGRAARPRTCRQRTAPHGPDRSDISVGGQHGLVHVLMRITPEDRYDRQPWRGASGATITADMRLDNRDDVLARIGVAPRMRRSGRIRAFC